MTHLKTLGTKLLSHFNTSLQLCHLDVSVNPYMLRVCFSTRHLDVSVVVVITKLKISSPNSLLLSPLCCASGERFRSFDLSKRPCCFYLWYSVWRSLQCVRVPPGLRLSAVHFEPWLQLSKWLHFCLPLSFTVKPKLRKFKVLISIQDSCFVLGQTQGLHTVAESELIHFLLA